MQILTVIFVDYKTVTWMPRENYPALCSVAVTNDPLKVGILSWSLSDFVVLGIVFSESLSCVIVERKLARAYCFVCCWPHTVSRFCSAVRHELLLSIISVNVFYLCQSYLLILVTQCP